MQETPRGPSPITSGVVLLVVAAVSVQLGAALGTSVLPALGVLGIVFARYLVMAAVHIPLAWKHLRVLPARQWLWGLVSGVPLLSMNLSIYMAFSHIGVGLSVTIELLGPIMLAVVTARSWPGWLSAALAFAGMVLVTGPTGSANLPGVLWALVAAVSWACYLAGVKAAGSRLPGLAPSAIASMMGLCVLTPVNLAFTDPSAITWQVLGIAALAGVLSSALPYAFDVLAMRRLPIHVASTMMSVNPLTATLWGAVILGERLGPAELVGLAVISAANVIVVHAARRPRRMRS